MGVLRSFDLKQFINYFGCETLFETGTGTGTGLEYGRGFEFNKIYSVEIIKAQCEKMSKKFSFDNRIEIINSSSLEAFKKYLPKIETNILFFLDAHFPGADLGLSKHGDEKDEDLRLPLFTELTYIKENRRNNKDVIIIDDIMLYDDNNNYEEDNWKRELDIAPRNHKNYLSKFIHIFADSHNYQHFLTHSGYLLFTPKI